MSEFFKIVPLSTVVQINSGIALPSIFKDIENVEGDYPFYKVAQMNNDIRVMKDADLKFTLAQSKELKIKLFPKGSILIPKRGGAILTNKKRILLEDASYDSNIMGLKANNTILTDEFLLMYMDLIDLSDYIDTSTIPQINNKHIEMMKIPLPPLEEQKRIVDKLNILFAKIDKAIALHQKNIDEANVFMASVLNDVFVELEEKYGLDNIGNMIDILTDYHSNGAYKNLKENVELLDKEDYALMIRATDLENEDYTNNVKYITESAYNFMSKSKVFGGEIILPKIGTIGNVYFMPYLERPVSLAMNLFMLRCSDKVMNKYMFLFLKSSRGNEDILNKANGAVTKTITKDAVRSIELPFPPIETQQKVVSYLDEISTKMEKIKQIQKEKMQNLKALKASILDQAFKGEL